MTATQDSGPRRGNREPLGVVFQPGRPADCYNPQVIFRHPPPFVSVESLLSAR